VFRPAYRLTIGSARVDSSEDPGESTVTGLTVALDLDTPADEAVIELAQVDGAAPALGGEVIVELGYLDDGLTKVFTGTVADVTAGITTTRVVAHSPMRKLLALRVDEMYQEMTAGRIVRDLCERAGVATATVEDGTQYPAYVVDGRRNAYLHVRGLADDSGFDVHADPDGRLVFRPFSGSITFHVFEYGGQLMDARGTELPRWAEALVVFGESPTDARGTEARGWLTKDFPAGRTGTGTVALLEDASLRTNAAAQAAADAADLRARQRTRIGRLRGLGRAAVALGDGVRVRGASEAGLNGSFQVRSVRHRLTKLAGLTTEVGYWSLGSET
jgi:phage protein D